MKQRMHLDIGNNTGIRTIFLVIANNNNCVNIKNDINFLAIMDKNDYSASHQVITKNLQENFLFTHLGVIHNSEIMRLYLTLNVLKKI